MNSTTRMYIGKHRVIDFSIPLRLTSGWSTSSSGGISCIGTPFTSLMPLEISHLLNGSGNTKTTKEKDKSRSTHTTTASLDPKLKVFSGKSWLLSDLACGWWSWWLVFVGVCRMFHDLCIYRHRFKRWLKYSRKALRGVNEVSDSSIFWLVFSGRNDPEWR